MNRLKGWVNALREVNLSRRQATVLAVASGTLLMVLMAIWLTMSTRTALLDQQLEELDRQQTVLTDDINQTWTEIGEVTSPRAMEDRARRLGYKPAEKLEYLVTTPEAPTPAPGLTTTDTLTSTTSLTTTETITP